MERSKLFLLATVALGAMAGYTAATANVAALLRAEVGAPPEGEPLATGQPLVYDELRPGPAT
jgi:hypothetical protein